MIARLQTDLRIYVVAAGWLHQTTRGHYEVPGARMIPLLVMVTAAEH